MSFSKDVKEELSKLNNLANKNEVKVELLGYFASNNINYTKNLIRYSTENEYNIDRFAKILRNNQIENFKINVNGKVFSIEINKKQIIVIEKFEFNTNNLEEIKAYFRGIFMGSGSINNPEKKYHLEFTIKDEENVSQIIELLKRYELSFKQKENIIYTKEGEEISKFLAFIGAAKSVLKFEEIRVNRSMNNKINRLVNCENANLNKTLNASVEQINAIKKLIEKGSFEKLEESLKEIARLRLEYPEMNLSELGKKLTIPLGKSGVNYRLKKIIKIAEEI